MKSIRDEKMEDLMKWANDGGNPWPCHRFSNAEWKLKCLAEIVRRQGERSKSLEERIKEEIIQELANLFGKVEDFDKMDAADFVDNAGKIWDLRQRAIKVIASMNNITH